MIDFILTFSAAALVFALLGAEAFGRVIAQRINRNTAEVAAESGRTGHVLTSTFGLLALLLGFSFGIALNRFDTRRADVVAEANAIGTAHYRAGFMPELGQQLQESLERYAAHRVDYGRTMLTERPQMEIVSARQRGEIAKAGQRFQPEANTPMGTLVVASVTEVLDIGVQREANIRAKLPVTVFVVLIGLSLVGAGMMGFAYPAGGLMRWGSSVLLFLLLTLTIGVLIDLDSPAGGGMRVDQTPMEQLVEDIHAAPSGGASNPTAQIERPAL